MRVDQLVQMYEEGALTAHHLMIEALNTIGPGTVDEVMEAIPPHLHEEMWGFLERFRPGAMRTNYGRVPSPENICQAKRWLSSRLIGDKAPRV